MRQRTVLASCLTLILLAVAVQPVPPASADPLPTNHAGLFIDEDGLFIVGWILASQPNLLTIYGLPAEGEFSIIVAGTTTVLASGTADSEGYAEVASLSPLTTADLTLEIPPTQSYTLPVIQDLSQVLSAPPPQETPPPDPTMLAAPNMACSTNCPPGQVQWDTAAKNWGHWLLRVEFWQITNDADPLWRYYITVTRWFGSGTTNDEPRHVGTTVYHVANNLNSAAGLPDMMDWDPVAQSGSSEDSLGFTVGVQGPSATYTWTHKDKPRITSKYSAIDGSEADQAGIAFTATFSQVNPAQLYTGKIEYVAEGKVPAGVQANAWVRMKHTSKVWDFGPRYNDDSDWIGSSITWT